ncbi:unnamed protein product [Mortierella alpina]
MAEKQARSTTSSKFEPQRSTSVPTSRDADSQATMALFMNEFPRALPPPTPAPTPARPTGGLKNTSYGTSCLFLTDYDQFDWLGYRRQQHSETYESQDTSEDWAISNTGAVALSQQDPALTLLTPGSSLGRQPSCPDSGFMSWDQGSFDKQTFQAPCWTEGETVSVTDKNHCHHLFTPLSQERCLMPAKTSDYEHIPVDFTKTHQERIPAASSSRELQSRQSRQSFNTLPTQLPPAVSVNPRIFSGHSVSHLDQKAPSSARSAPCSSNVLSPQASSHQNPSIRVDPRKGAGIPSRYLKVSDCPRDVSIWVARDAFKSYGDLKGIFTKFLESDGVMYLEFFDIRHAMTAAKLLHTNAIFKAVSAKVQFCPKSALEQVASDIWENENEGILVLSLVTPKLIDNDLLRLMSSYGEVQSFQHESEEWPPVFLVGYYDVRHAAFAKAALQRLHENMRFQCKVSYYQKERVESSRLWHQQQLSHPVSTALSASERFRPDSYSVDAFQTNSKASHSAADATDDMLSMRASALSILTSSSGSSDTQTSSALSSFQIQGQYAWDSGLPWLNPDAATTTAMPWSSSGAGFLEPVPTKSVPANRMEGSSRTTADVVRSGIDSKNHTMSQNSSEKRTTFMIRNIPNKYTQQMLLELINETHRGKFDFLYLRMDFKNRCNVGYAFINFINADVIDSFVKAHVGKKWPRFNSDKICSLSFAAVQGRHALIEKFRNSR